MVEPFPIIIKIIVKIKKIQVIVTKNTSIECKLDI